MTDEDIKQLLGASGFVILTRSEVEDVLKLLGAFQLEGEGTAGSTAQALQASKEYAVQLRRAAKLVGIPTNWIAKQYDARKRLERLAAAALQGLLASGHVFPEHAYNAVGSAVDAARALARRLDAGEVG